MIHTSIIPVGMPGSQLRDAPKFKQVAGEIQTKLQLLASTHAQLPIIMMGHNAFGCDLPIMYWNLLASDIPAHQWFVDSKVIAVFDTLRLAKYVSKIRGDKGNSVEDLYIRYVNKQIDHDQYHDALVDATATTEIIMQPAFTTEMSSTTSQSKKLRCTYLQSIDTSVHDLKMKRISKEYHIDNPMSSYTCFMKETTVKLKLEHPEMAHKHVSSEIGRLWRIVKSKPDILSKYETQSVEDNVRYQREIKARKAAYPAMIW